MSNIPLCNIRSIHMTAEVLIYNKEQGKDYLETCDLELLVSGNGTVIVASCTKKE